jgi:hypothetical protein
MSNWIKIENRLPDTDRKVIALAGQDTLLAWVEDDEWYIAARMKLGGVTKWMEMPGEPKDFAYWLRQLKEWWGRRKVNIQETSDYLTGWTSRNAQLDKKIVYFANERTGEIRMGLPENFPATKGFNKVVCNNTREAEAWSDRLRQYNLSKEARTDEARERIEGPMREQIRADMHHRMANSSSKLGKEFIARYLEKMDKRDGNRMVREEYLHSEAYEKNH